MNLLYWYIICITLIVGLTIISIKLKFKKELVYLIMCVVCIVSELTKIMTHIIETNYPDGSLFGYYLTPAALPFHLCSLFIFLYGYLALSKNDGKKAPILEFVVPVGLIAGSLGVIFASSGTSFKDPSAYQSFLYHSFVVWFALYFMITKQVKIGKDVYVRNLIIMTLLMILGIWINSILRVNVITEGRYINFMFLAKPPMSGLPLLNLNHGWHAYFAHMVFCCLLMVSLVHVPYVIIEARNNKKELEENK